MINPPQTGQSDDIKQMFTHIAETYDRAIRWISVGLDQKWRRQVLKQADLPAGGRFLDVGAGKGKPSLEAIF